jgi:hypothetical protein
MLHTNEVSLEVAAKSSVAYHGHPGKFSPVCPRSAVES